MFNMFFVNSLGREHGRSVEIRVVKEKPENRCGQGVGAQTRLSWTML